MLSPVLSYLLQVCLRLQSLERFVHLQWAVATNVDFSHAQLIQVINLLNMDMTNGIGHEASRYVVIAFTGKLPLQT
uniref:Uncharacterized protein n=1 Tax=Nelumbo nucifera TaxID=4432 RepID=A0A822YV50_NELNU|nr:TPA_asm: hypothetical protein HUJ06_006091 [Nelumbo nucifera]